jgi:hypothetical protein
MPGTVEIEKRRVLEERRLDTLRVETQRESMLKEHPPEITRGHKRPQAIHATSPKALIKQLQLHSPLSFLYDSHEEQLMTELEASSAKQVQPIYPTPTPKFSRKASREQRMQQEITHRLQQKHQQEITHRLQQKKHQRQMQMLFEGFPDKDHKKVRTMPRITGMRADEPLPLDHVTYTCRYHKTLEAQECEKTRWISSDSLKRDVMAEGFRVEALSRPGTRPYIHIH